MSNASEYQSSINNFAGGESVAEGDRPVVSVVVPTWNVEQTIGRALASVLDPPDASLECIVVDDASTDRTVDVVEAIATKDPRVLFRSLPFNQGVSNARNRGLEIARGTWLTFLDADDCFRPGGLTTLVRTAQETDALVVIGQQVWTDGTRTWLSSFYDTPDVREPGRKSLARNPGLLYYVSPHGKLIHRSCAEELRFEGRVLGDQAWIISALLRAGDRIQVVADTVYEWTRHDPGTVAPSITTETRSSAWRGVEAAAVAELALATVRAEADRVLEDPAERAVIVARYAERLLRSDLAVHLSKALGRGDPATGELLSAIERFVRSVPPGVLAESKAMIDAVLKPPMRRWGELSVATQDAYLSLCAAAVTADPDVWRGMSSRASRIAVRLTPILATPVRRPVIVGILRADSIFAGVRSRFRPSRR